MYEFRVRVELGIGEKGEDIERGEQIFIISAESENELDAEDQIRYLVENEMEVLNISQIMIGG